MQNIATNRPTSPPVATLIPDIFLDIISAMRGKRHGISPTGIQCFNIWVRQAIIDVQNDYHDHHAPTQLAKARTVSVGRTKQNLSEIYATFNVCCEPELYMLLRVAYLLLESGLEKGQVAIIVWSHIRS